MSSSSISTVSSSNSESMKGGDIGPGGLTALMGTDSGNQNIQLLSIMLSQCTESLNNICKNFHLPGCQDSFNGGGNAWRID